MFISVLYQITYRPTASAASAAVSQFTHRLLFPSLTADPFLTHSCASFLSLFLHLSSFYSHSLLSLVLSFSLSLSFFLSLSIFLSLSLPLSSFYSQSLFCIALSPSLILHFHNPSFSLLLSYSHSLCLFLSFFLSVCLSSFLFPLKKV